MYNVAPSPYNMSLRPSAVPTASSGILIVYAGNLFQAEVCRAGPSAGSWKGVTGVSGGRGWLSGWTSSPTNLYVSLGKTCALGDIRLFSNKKSWVLGTTVVESG